LRVPKQDLKILGLGFHKTSASFSYNYRISEP
jgi:hypothetical protein